MLDRDPSRLDTDRGGQGAKAPTRVGQGVTLEGRLRFSGNAHIEGEVRGRIESEGSLEVGQEAAVSADVHVGHLVIHGVTQGNVVAAGSVEIHSSGELRGDLTTPALTVHRGALFHGRCDMGKDS